MASKSAAVHEREPRIEILKLKDEKVKFTVADTDISTVNALRRVMIGEVPTFAIDLVYIIHNESVLHDEFVAHRLGLIPIRWKLRDCLPQEKFPFPYECECDFTYSDVCRNCSVEFRLDVSNDADADGDAIKVTSKDLTFADPAHEDIFEIAHYVTNEEAERCKADDGIVINKLGPGQRLTLRAVAQMGIGRVHAKWNPTATVSMRYEPDIRLNYELLERVTAKDKKDFVKRCQPGVFSYDAATEQITIVNAKKASNLDEIKKVGALISKSYTNSENIVSVGFVPERYTFVVETSGALAPEQIVSSALSILMRKMGDMETACRAATQTAPSLAYSGGAAR